MYGSDIKLHTFCILWATIGLARALCENPILYLIHLASTSQSHPTINCILVEHGQYRNTFSPGTFPSPFCPFFSHPSRVLGWALHGRPRLPVTQYSLIYTFHFAVIVLMWTYYYKHKNLFGSIAKPQNYRLYIGNDMESPPSRSIKNLSFLFVSSQMRRCLQKWQSPRNLYLKRCSILSLHLNNEYTVYFVGR